MFFFLEEVISGNELLYLPVLEEKKKNSLAGKLCTLQLSVTSFSPTPEDLLQSARQLVKSWQCKLMFELWHECRQTQRQYYFLEETSFSLNNVPFFFHSDNLVWDYIVVQSSKVSHSNYTLVKICDLLQSSDKCTLFSLVGWYVGNYWYLLCLVSSSKKCSGIASDGLLVGIVSTNSHSRITLCWVEVWQLVTFWNRF